jgi:molybdopterin converting factor small subunit
MDSIRVSVRLFATLRRFFPDYNPDKGIELDVVEGTTVESLIQTLRLPPNEARVVLINGISKKPTDPVKEGDQVSLFTPLGGG